MKAEGEMVRRVKPRSSPLGQQTPEAGRGAPDPRSWRGAPGPPKLGEESPDPRSWERGLEQSAPHSRAQTELAWPP